MANTYYCFIKCSAYQAESEPPIRCIEQQQRVMVDIESAQKGGAHARLQAARADGGTTCVSLCAEGHHATSADSLHTLELPG